MTTPAPQSPATAPHVPVGAEDRTLAARRRLEDAMAVAVAEKGLAATTIADVARHAGTSKRTFSEHYAHKTAGLPLAVRHPQRRDDRAGGCRTAPRRAAGHGAAHQRRAPSSRSSPATRCSRGGTSASSRPSGRIEPGSHVATDDLVETATRFMTAVLPAD